MVGRPYAVAGITYVPSEKRYSAVGVASWYGDAFQGRLTANGEVFDKMAVAAAHPTLPLPCYARVTNLANNHSMIVRVNDRGPYAAGRVMDVSERVAQALDFHGSGTSRVRVDYVGKASIDGSDDAKLMATLRTDGTVASLNTGPDLGHSMFADASTPDWPKAPGASARPLRPAQARSQATAVVAQAPADDQPSEHLTVAVRAPLPPTRPFDDGARRQLTALVAATGSAAPVERRTKAASVASAAMPVRRPAEAVLHESDKAGLSKAAAEHPAVRKPKRPEPDSQPQT